MCDLYVSRDVGNIFTDICLTAQALFNATKIQLKDHTIAVDAEKYAVI